MQLPRLTALAALAATAAPHVVLADVPHADDGADYATPIASGRDIVVVIPGERSSGNLGLCAGLAGGGLLVGAVGLYFHLQSKSDADAVSAHEITGKQWTTADQATFDHAHDNAVKAGIFYGIGGALAISAIVTWIVTEPKAEKRVIHPHGGGSGQATFAPTPGGALVGRAWRF